MAMTLFEEVAFSLAAAMYIFLIEKFVALTFG